MYIRIDKIEAEEIRSVYEGDWIHEYYGFKNTNNLKVMEINQKILMPPKHDTWYLPFLEVGNLVLNENYNLDRILRKNPPRIRP